MQSYMVTLSENGRALLGSPDPLPLPEARAFGSALLLDRGDLPWLQHHERVGLQALSRAVSSCGKDGEVFSFDRWTLSVRARDERPSLTGYVHAAREGLITDEEAVEGIRDASPSSSAILAYAEQDRAHGAFTLAVGLGLAEEEFRDESLLGGMDARAQGIAEGIRRVEDRAGQMRREFEGQGEGSC